MFEKKHGENYLQYVQKFACFNAFRDVFNKHFGTSASNYAVVRTRMSPIPEQSVTYRNVTKFKTGNDELDWGELQIIPVG